MQACWACGLRVSSSGCAAVVIWFTGLSGAGKTTVCVALHQALKPTLPELVVLDGDMVRATFDDGLGYSEADRVVQISRLQRLARMLSDQGLVVLVAALYASPALLEWNRLNIPEYFEVYLKASLATVMCRDAKGLYRRAVAGETNNMVGLDIPWRAPEAPDMIIDADRLEPPDAIAKRVIDALPRLARAVATA
jgi:adenylyl-sulfate kinase